MAERKNSYYVSLVKEIDKSALIDGAIDFISYVKKNALKTAIGSSSKNTNLILSQTGIDSMFDAIADGNIIIKSKPDPEVFLKAAELLGIDPCDCLVFLWLLFYPAVQPRCISKGKKCNHDSHDFYSSNHELNSSRILIIYKSLNPH